VNVEPRSDASVQFCNGFSVGGRLRWPVDFELSEDWAILTSPKNTSVLNSSVNTATISSPVCFDGSLAGLRGSMLTTTSGELPAAPISREDSKSAVDLGIPPYAWLKEQIELALGSEWEADSLVAGVEVILGDESGAGQGVEDDMELLAAASEMLLGEGVPDSVLTEFLRRWAEMREISSCC